MLLHPFPLESLTPECTAIPDIHKRDRSASGLQKLSWRWSLPSNALMAWGCHLCEHTARCEGDLLRRKLSLLLTGVHTAGQVPQLSAGATSCVHWYRRNLNMIFLLSSVFLWNLCFHIHSCSEKCHGSDSSTPLTDFLQWNVTVWQSHVFSLTGCSVQWGCSPKYYCRQQYDQY